MVDFTEQRVEKLEGSVQGIEERVAELFQRAGGKDLEKLEGFKTLEKRISEIEKQKREITVLKGRIKELEGSVEIGEEKRTDITKRLEGVEASSTAIVSLEKKDRKLMGSIKQLEARYGTLDSLQGKIIGLEKGDRVLGRKLEAVKVGEKDVERLDSKIEKSNSETQRFGSTILVFMEDINRVLSEFKSGVSRWVGTADKRMDKIEFKIESIPELREELISADRRISSSLRKQNKRLEDMDRQVVSFVGRQDRKLEDIRVNLFSELEKGEGKSKNNIELIERRIHERLDRLGNSMLKDFDKLEVVTDKRFSELSGEIDSLRAGAKKAFVLEKRFEDFDRSVVRFGKQQESAKSGLERLQEQLKSNISELKSELTVSKGLEVSVKQLSEKVLDIEKKKEEMLKQLNEKTLSREELKALEESFNRSVGNLQSELQNWRGEIQSLKERAQKLEELEGWKMSTEGRVLAIEETVGKVDKTDLEDLVRRAVEEQLAPKGTAV
ncbi:MAG: hypothetical protein HY362_03680 [Candidatus Aenigmarchaeota archaeon]|nr:hypothetical protein [Candidatus Aenigmarchaeota archaeon]